MENSSMTRRGLLLFVAMCLIWGIPYLFIRIAVSELTPATLVFLRTGIAALVLLPIAIRQGGMGALLGKWRPLVIFAVIEIGIPWLALSTAEQQISSSLAGLLISAVPLVGTVIAPLFGNRDRMGPVNIAGLLLGLVGVAAIVGFDLRATGWIPLAEMAVVVVGYAVGPAVLSRYLSGLSSVSVTAVSLAMCAIAYAPVAAIQWPHRVPSTGVLASVAVLAFVCTALAFLIFFALIAEIGPVRATVITYINPAVAAGAGILVLHETFTAGMGVGFVLVLIGSTLATRRARGVGPAAQAEPVTVREGSAADLDAIAAVRVNSWKDTYRPLIGGQVVDPLLDVREHRRDMERILDEGQALLLIAEDANRAVAGFALSHLGEGGEPFLESLHVQPGRRSHGIGALLLRETAARWAAGGHRSMSLHVVESNLRAKRFYDRFGGREVGVVVSDWRGAQVSQAIYRWNELAVIGQR
jgi:drug/metabolite transporter (DMT)-like permease/ribosomal protein S18 acetylase RimI-like enzyme